MRVGSLLMLLLLPLTTFAQDALPKFPEKFELKGHTAYFYAAPKPAEGKPWVWYHPTLKAIPLVLRRFYFEGFLNAGIGIAGYDLGEVRGGPDSTAQFTLFYDEMVKRGWSSKPILFGQSRGGLMALAWAMRHPEKTQAIVGIYPVFNLQTWGLKNLPVTLADYKMTEGELRGKITDFNPIDNLKGLIEKKVPIFVVQGDADKAVPHKENVIVLKERYEAGKAPITLKLYEGLGHQTAPEFFENKELLDFVWQQASQKAKQP